MDGDIGLGRVLKELLLASYGLYPEDLARHVAGAARHLGGEDVVLWSSATVGGTPLLDVVGPDGDRVQAEGLNGLAGEVRDAAQRIIAGKGSTNLAIGLATARIARAIALDEHAVLPVSVRVDVAGVGEVCMSVPSVVGRRGVLSRLPLKINDVDRAALQRSARALRAVINDVT